MLRSPPTHTRSIYIRMRSSAMQLENAGINFVVNFADACDRYKLCHSVTVKQYSYIAT